MLKIDRVEIKDNTIIFGDDGYNTVAFAFDRKDQKLSRSEFYNNDSSLTVSPRMIRIESKNTSVMLDSSPELYNKVKELIK